MIRNIEARMAQAMSKGKCPPLVVPHALADCAVLDTEQTEAWPRYLRLPVDMGFWDLRIHCAAEEPANEKAA